MYEVIVNKPKQRVHLQLSSVSVYLLSLRTYIALGYLVVFGTICSTILNLSTVHTSLQHFLVIFRPKYIGIRLHFGEFSD